MFIRPSSFSPWSDQSQKNRFLPNPSVDQDEASSEKSPTTTFPDLSPVRTQQLSPVYHTNSKPLLPWPPSLYSKEQFNTNKDKQDQTVISNYIGKYVPF